jgi:hypothetical protein
VSTTASQPAASGPQTLRQVSLLECQVSPTKVQVPRYPGVLYRDLDCLVTNVFVSLRHICAVPPQRVVEISDRQTQHIASRRDLRLQPHLLSCWSAIHDKSKQQKLPRANRGCGVVLSSHSRCTLPCHKAPRILPICKPPASDLQRARLAAVV